ncbi:hypothetical protein HDU79_011593 [Rhizoclosmatium sp. JEL0117]|nr:hypothetical protein HDU79_011593 [Rhizoclosmatium sp. JEL0117]
MMKRNNSFQDDDEQIAATRAIHNSVISFWNTHKAGVTEWWRSLDRKAKLEFLLDVSPISPQLGFKLVRNDNTHFIIPELVPEACSDIPALFEQFCWAGEGDLATGPINLLGWARKKVEECTLEVVAVGQLTILRSQIRKGLLIDKRNEYPNTFIQLVGEKIGRRLQRNTKVPKHVDPVEFAKGQKRMDEYRDAGLWCYAEEWNLLQKRLYYTVNTLSIIAEEYKSEVLGKGGNSGFKTIKLAHGCNSCKKKTQDSGAPLKACACSFTFYCGSDCQQADWENHKTDHHSNLAFQKGCGTCKFRFREANPSAKLTVR